MKNGIHSDKHHTLTLVDSDQDAFEDAPAGHTYQKSTDDKERNTSLAAEDARQAKTTFFVLIGISAACATAAVATGSYAAWLSRHQAARKALTDVNDLLRSCQSRMTQLEADVQRLPNRQA